MARINFTLEEYKQHPDWKVETRDGRKAFYIGEDSTGWQVVEIDKTFYKYHFSSLYNAPEESPFDLFLVTPEEELTEFELYLHDVIDAEIEKDSGLKEVAKELLNLAEKELASRYKVSSDLNGFTYGKGYEDGIAEALKERSQNIVANLIEDRIKGIQHDLIEFLSNTIDASWADVIKSADAYATRIRNGILKDLPRWKKCDGQRCIPDSLIQRSGLYAFGSSGQTGDKFILLRDLEKLPKED